MYRYPSLASPHIWPREVLDSAIITFVAAFQWFSELLQHSTIAHWPESELSALCYTLAARATRRGDLLYIKLLSSILQILLSTRLFPVV